MYKFIAEFPEFKAHLSNTPTFTFILVKKRHNYNKGHFNYYLSLFLILLSDLF